MDYHIEAVMAKEGCGLWFCHGLAPARIKAHAAVCSLPSSRTGDRIGKAQMKNLWLDIKTA